MGCCNCNDRLRIDPKKLEGLKIDKEFASEALNKINEYRKLHGVEELNLDNYLNKKALIIAKQKTKSIENEDLLYAIKKPLGINKKIYEKKLKAKELIDEWYNDKENYNFNEPEQFEDNNFTKLIWKSSKKFGIGYFCSNENSKEQKKYYYVALFYPQGNIPDEYESNVFKPKKMKRNSKENDKNNTKIGKDIDDESNLLNQKETYKKIPSNIEGKISSNTEERNHIITKRESKQNIHKKTYINEFIYYNYKKNNDQTEKNLNGKSKEPIVNEDLSPNDK